MFLTVPMFKKVPKQNVKTHLHSNYYHITYSTHDLMCDVISDCSWSCDRV